MGSVNACQFDVAISLVPCLESLCGIREQSSFMLGPETRKCRLRPSRNGCFNISPTSSSQRRASPPPPQSQELSPKRSLPWSTFGLDAAKLATWPTDGDRLPERGNSALWSAFRSVHAVKCSCRGTRPRSRADLPIPLGRRHQAQNQRNTRLRVRTHRRHGASVGGAFTSGRVNPCEATRKETGLRSLLGQGSRVQIPAGPP
jgi:hypothetical protein